MSSANRLRKTMNAPFTAGSHPPRPHDRTIPIPDPPIFRKGVRQRNGPANSTKNAPPKLSASVR